MVHALASVLSLTLLSVACTPTPVRDCPWAKAWMCQAGEKRTTGVASYAIFGELHARKKSLGRALATLVALKSGTADVTENVVRQQLSTAHSYSDNSRINTQLTIQGKQIPLNIRIVEYWKNQNTQQVWVLIEDLDEHFP